VTITGPFYTYCPIHFTNRNASFLWHLSVCLSHTSHRLPFVYSVLERRRKYMFYGDLTTYISEWEILLHVSCWRLPKTGSYRWHYSAWSESSGLLSIRGLAGSIDTACAYELLDIGKP